MLSDRNKDSTPLGHHMNFKETQVMTNNTNQDTELKVDKWDTSNGHALMIS